MKEEWKTYKNNSKNIYEVSNFGNVKKNGKLVDFSKQKRYYQVGHFFVHRAVAELFIPNLENKPCVDHIDTNIHNNKVDNLQWCTYSENSNNPLTLEHISKSLKGLFVGENNPMYGRSVKECMTDVQIEIWRQNLSIARKRRKESIETIRKRTEKFIGFKHTEESKEKNRQWHLTHKCVLCEDGKRHYVKI